MIASSASTSQIARMLPIAGAVVALDLLTKILMQNWLGTGGSWWLIEDRLGFELVHNERFAFNLGPQSGPAATIVLVAVGLLIALFVSTQLASAPLPLLGASLILGGAIGNAINRAFSNYVVDYVAVLSFPRFNVADASLTVGLALIAGYEIWQARGNRTEP
jgi:signal peptidase II